MNQIHHEDEGENQSESEAPEGVEDDQAGAEATDAEGDLEVSYEHTPRGHRVTRRTVRRREMTEDTEETITDSYPVLYQPPSVTSHPAPVG